MNTINLILKSGMEMNVDISVINLNNPHKIGIRSTLIRFCLFRPQIQIMYHKSKEISFFELKNLKREKNGINN